MSRLHASADARLAEALARVRGFGPVVGRAVLAERPDLVTLRVFDGNTALAVRLHRPGSVSGERLSEIARAIDAAAAAGVAPRVRHLDDETGALITEWAPGPTWTARDLRNADRILALGGTLGALHRVPSPIPPIDLAAHAARYRERFERHGLTDREVRALDELDRRVRDHERLRSTTWLGHNDVTVGNLVGAGRPFLIDWEYAGGSDRSFDLATAIALHELDDRGRTALLDAYDGNTEHPIERDRVVECERLVVLLAWAWARSASADRAGDERADGWARRLDARV